MLARPQLHDVSLRDPARAEPNELVSSHAGTQRVNTRNQMLCGQPITSSNPIHPHLRYLHNLPAWWHSLETAVNHVVELLLPWLLLFPRKARIIGGVCQIAFQVVLITSGNLSFLNWCV